jgi:hypothetical protein
MKHIMLILALATFSGGAMAQEIDGGPTATTARKEIEREGYRNVQGLAKDSDGVWHGRALRGNTEVQLLVDDDGNVSVNR